jgi:hypothetical protein
MEDQEPSEANTNPSDSSSGGSALTKGQEEEHTHVNENNETSESQNNAGDIPAALASENILRKAWNFIRSPEFQGPATALSTILIAFFTAATWVVILTGSEDTKRAATAAQSFSSTAALIRGDLQKAVADNNQAIRDTLAENRIELAKVLGQNRQTLESATTQSKAALDATINASKLDQRAWIGVGTVSTLAFGLNTVARFDIPISNTGKTPATDVVFCGFPYSPQGEDPCPLDRSHAKVSAAVWNVGPVMPGSVVHQWMQTAYLLDENDVQGRDGMRLVGTIWYNDVSGRAHWITFCRYYDGKNDRFEVCYDHNDMDRNGIEPK